MHALALTLQKGRPGKVRERPITSFYRLSLTPAPDVARCSALYFVLFCASLSVNPYHLPGRRMPQRLDAVEQYTCSKLALRLEFHFVFTGFVVPVEFPNRFP